MRAVHLTLLAVPGCPNLAVLEDQLATVLASFPHVTVSRRVIADEQAASRWGMHGSPTLLVDGADPFAAPGQRASLSCRLYLGEDGRAAGVPTQAQIRRALVEAAQANRFTDRLRAGWSAGRFACVGLDPDRGQLLATTPPGDPAQRTLEVGRAHLDAWEAAR